MAGGAGGGGADGRGAARVALFPLPFQGHISPMLQLAGALRARGLAVTVLHTAFNAPDPARHPGLAFVAVPDAIPEAAAAAANGIAKILALNAAMEASGRVRAALASLMAAEGQPRLACLVLDFIASLADGSYAASAIGLDTIDLGALSFWRPCAAAHPAHGLRRACPVAMLWSPSA